MLTLCAVPPQDDNSLLAAYHGGLRAHWPRGARLLSHWLAAMGQGGWSASERLLLPDSVRRSGLSMRDRKAVHRLLNPAAFPLAANPLKNKQLFALKAQEAGLPIPPACDPEAQDLADWLARESDIIAKPSFRSKGQGVERYIREGERWRGPSGAISDTQLRARLIALGRKGGVIQRRLATHERLSDLSPGALPTLRVVTCINEDGLPEACDLALRLSAGGPRPVDNFNAGNLVLGVDSAGCCMAAWRRSGQAVVALERHPVSGAPIKGVPVPDLADAIALALRAHRAFADGFTVIGWDVGLTPGGPVLVEGNWNPGTDIVQLVSGRGVSDTRLGALYRHHLAHLPVERWRRVQVMAWDLRGR